MNPTVAFVIVELIKLGIPAGFEILQLLAKDNITQADWDALKAKWSKSPEDYLAEAEARAALK